MDDFGMGYALGQDSGSSCRYGGSGMWGGDGSWIFAFLIIALIFGGRGGLFGGEGFIMQRLSGNGTAFVEIDGYVKEYELAAGQQMIIDTGYLAAMDATCTMDITTVKGLKNKVLGGEGFFNTVVTGPGKIYLQSMPINQMAGVLQPFLSTNK